jgi:hypothetical protein
MLIRIEDEQALAVKRVRPDGPSSGRCQEGPTC